MSDTVWLAWIAIAGLVIKQVLEWVSQWLADRRAKAAAAVIAKKVDEVRADLGVKTDATDKKLEGIHTLVNSAMGKQLRAVYDALHRVAELTKHPDDVVAAKSARDAMIDHELQQAKADVQKKEVPISLAKQIEEVPEKTAEKVIEKMDEQKKDA